MKKFALLILSMLMVLTLSAQDRTISTKVFTTTQTYLLYTGVDADTLTEFQDSIAMEFKVNKEYPCQLYILTELDTIDGADTTVTCYLQGRMFNTQSWANIANTAGTVAAATENIVTTVAQQSGTMAWDTSGSVYVFAGTFTNTNVMNFYREFRLIYKLAGNDHVGTGVEIKSIAIKIWRREF